MNIKSVSVIKTGYILISLVCIVFFAFYFLLCYPSAVTPKQVVTLYNLFFLRAVGTDSFKYVFNY